MPNTLHKEYTNTLLSKEEYESSEYTLKASITLTPSGLGANAEFHRFENAKEGCVVVNEEGNKEPLANLLFTFTENKFFNNIQCIAINSSFVKDDYRGLGIAPHAYKILIDNYNVLSDFEQTRHGSHLWKTKIPKFKDVNVHVLTNFDEVLLDAEGKPVIYIHDPSGKNPLDDIIWGVDDYEDVRLIAVKKK